MRVNGFYGHIQKNHGRSILLFIGFAVACQIAFGILLTLPIIVSGSTRFIFVQPLDYFADWGSKTFLASCILFAARYKFHVFFLRQTTGLEPVSQFQEPRLMRIVADLAATAGLREPTVSIIPTGAMNAFACGLSRNNANIIVTRGLLNALTDDELQAVIAHEIAHIDNGDMAMMAVANASMGTVEMLTRLNPFRFRGTKSAILALFFLPLMFLFAVFGFASHVANTITKITRLLIASSREFIADAEAVRLTHNPAALISALRKINGRSTIEGLDPMTAAMMIDGPTEGAYASHPTIAERIQVLTQLSGAMIHGAATHRDSRTDSQRQSAKLAQYGTATPGFAQANANPFNTGYAASSNAAFFNPSRVPQRATPRNIIDRVNVGNDTNALGAKSGVGRVIVIGLIVMFSVQMCAVSSVNKTFSHLKTSEGLIDLNQPRQAVSGVIKPLHAPIHNKITVRDNTETKSVAAVKPRLKPKPKPTTPPPALRGRKTDER